MTKDEKILCYTSRIIASAIGIVIIVTITVNCIQNQIRYNELVEKNIYLVWDDVGGKAEQGSLCRYYMICRPEAEESKLKKQVETFFETDEIKELRKRYFEIHQDGEIIFCFMYPSERIGIGYFPANFLSPSYEFTVYVWKDKTEFIF